MTFLLSTLGRLDLRADDGTEIRTLLAQPKRFAVLVFLACQPPGSFTRRDTLLGLFWPELDQDRARTSLRKALHFIRQALGADVLLSRAADEIAIRRGTVETDALLMKEDAAAGRHGTAADRYAGDFLPGLYVESAPELERWIAEQREQLRRIAADAAWAEAHRELHARQPAAARRWADRAKELSPHDELAARRFIELLARTGDRAAAIQAYESFATRLAADFALAPSPETRALVDSLRRQTEPAGRPEPLPVPVAVPVPEVRAKEGTRPPPPEAAPSPAISVGARRRRMLPRLAAALGIVALLATIATALRDSRRASAEETDRHEVVRIHPFTVHGPEEIAYLGAGMPILLGDRLDGAGALSVRSGARAAPESADFEIAGSVVATAGGVRIAAELTDAAGRSIAAASIEGPEVRLHALVDQLATRLLADRMRESGAEVAERAVRATSSLPALKAWLQGELALRDGRYAPAMAAFAAATRADSTFAFGYYRLALAASWAGEMPLVLPNAERAVALSAGQPSHARDLFRAFLAARQGRAGAAERLYRTLTATHPGDVDAWYELAELLYHGHPTTGKSIVASRFAFEQVLRQDSAFFPALMHLSRLAAARRDRSALEALSERALRHDPDGTHRAELLLLRGLGLGHAPSRAASLALAPTSGTIDALWRSVGYTSNLRGGAEIASALLRTATEPELRAGLLLLLSHLAVGQRDEAAAARHLEALSAIAPRSAATTRAMFALIPGRDAPWPAPVGTTTASDATIWVGAAAADSAPVYGALVFAGAALRRGDSTAARRLVAAAEGARARSVVDAVAHGYLRARLADDSRATVAAADLIPTTDSILAERYSSPSPFFPRALLHLALSDVLARAGRVEEALARLSAVPEDFGFDVALHVSVHERRAALLRQLGRDREAAIEARRASEIVGAPAPPG